VIWRADHDHGGNLGAMSGHRTDVCADVGDGERLSVLG
jgi:hypothetical protein